MYDSNIIASIFSLQAAGTGGDISIALASVNVESSTGQSSVADSAEIDSSKYFANISKSSPLHPYPMHIGKFNTSISSQASS